MLLISINFLLDCKLHEGRDLTRRGESRRSERHSNLLQDHTASTRVPFSPSFWISTLEEYILQIAKMQFSQLVKTCNLLRSVSQFTLLHSATSWSSS